LSEGGVAKGGPGPLAAIISLAGTSLLEEERLLLEERRPAGVILFARNCRDRRQLRGLVETVRAAVGDPELPVLIDQEGGRVMRLRPPEWRELPSMALIGQVAQREMPSGLEAAGLAGALIAADLREVGITIDCAPVLDVAGEATTTAIGDRSFSGDPELVGALGRALADGLLSGGVLPVMKHLPGHGRAGTDSHLALPRVDVPLDELRRRDFVPFRACRDLPLAMTAHVVYSACDPDHPATVSRRVIADIIRGEIGFSGVLLSDDLSMRALTGPLPERAQAALEAGCDLALYCAGQVDEARAVLDAVPPLDPTTDRLLRGSLLNARAAAGVDVAHASASFDKLLSAA
jgi:beta-N-acetylhexosaminidase